MASASRAPLLGLFGVLVKEWIPLIDEYYYCVFSGSLALHFTDVSFQILLLNPLGVFLFSVVVFVVYHSYAFDG